MRSKASMLFALGLLAGLGSVQAANPPPSCRLDSTNAGKVRNAVLRAAAAYKQLGKPLPFDAVSINDPKPAAGSLSVYIVKDAAKGSTKPPGCTGHAPAADDELDDLSVRGGCVLVSSAAMEMRCSSQAVRVFANTGNRADRESPTLLYVVSHELGHLYQRQSGEYSGRAEVIDLKASRQEKLEQLQGSCDPASIRTEQQADEFALDVLKLDLGKAPYRETTLSERGSLYWNIDLLALAANEWTKQSAQREFISRPKLHPAFEPTTFPTPPEVVKANARRFVCGVLNKTSGRVLYPGKSTTHPPVEQRIRRIAEVLQPVAKSLPSTGGSQQFAPVVRLQDDLGPIFTTIYEGTGVYLESVHTEICTIVNSPQSHPCD